ncbi:MAG TPA: LptF/LptG family permease [Eudoraea sp.]|nr:LptF/LptG family permease [Eudoraea sp.]
MRILDLYILKRFLFNFVSSFVILMFIFIFQTIWLFIDDFAGKGLDLVIIGKFLFYLMPNLTEKVLPLTVLLSSILTFGTFAENYEFAAMKASGISLQRSMLSLIIFVTCLGGVTFYFANNVIPASEQKIYNLRRNIATVKPAAVIEEGVFSDFEGMNIKVDNKYGENDRYLENVILHKKSNLQKNNTVIKANSGELISSEGSPVIQLVLKDGHYYEDVVSESKENRRNFPFVRSNFETYTINIEIPQDDQDLEEERNVRTDKMKNISRLNKDIDSLRRSNLQVVRAFSKNISNRMGAFVPLRPKDTVTSKTMVDSLPGETMVDSLSAETMVDSLPAVTMVDTLPAKSVKDTILSTDNEVQADSAMTQQEKAPVAGADPRSKTVDNVLDLYQKWQRSQLLGSANNTVSNVLNTIRGKKEQLDRNEKIYNMHILSLHKKFALALSCIILFFVGAPLGAIIRKGGLGLPMVIAIVLFLAYYFFGVFAGNYAKEGNIHPILGAWLSTLIMLPLGISLTRRATADRGLMSFGHVVDFFRELFKSKKDAAV